MQGSDLHIIGFGSFLKAMFYHICDSYCTSNLVSNAQHMQNEESFKQKI